MPGLRELHRRGNYAKAEGAGNCTGKASAAFAIDQVGIKGAKVKLPKADFAYSGKARKPAVKSVGGEALEPGADYAVRERPRSRLEWPANRNRRERSVQSGSARNARHRCAWRAGAVEWANAETHA